jgi:hypothetical protein
MSEVVTIRDILWRIWAPLRCPLFGHHPRQHLDNPNVAECDRCGRQLWRRSGQWV